MRLHFLGTGDCAGIPVYNCDCQVCSESRLKPALRRQGSGALLTAGPTRVLIDAGPPHLEQHLGSPPDLILLSHYHIDHVFGLFPLRWGCRDQPIPVFGPDDPAGCADLFKHPGILDFRAPLAPFVSHRHHGLEILPLPLNHSKPSLGFFLEYQGGRLAWLCDTGGLPEPTLTFLQRRPPQLMVLDCTLPPQEDDHPNHNDIERAIALHQRIGAQATCLTHVSHRLDLWLATTAFVPPAGVTIAADGMTLDIGP
jgi:phosphoribosyl 1,2-cyclic phosphate phosphodiesterase